MQDDSDRGIQGLPHQGVSVGRLHPIQQHLSLQHCLPQTVLDLQRIGEREGGEKVLKTGAGKGKKSSEWEAGFSSVGLGGAKRWEGLRGGAWSRRERRRFQAVTGLGQYHHALEGLGQRKLPIAILDPKDHEGRPVHVLPVQEPARQGDVGSRRPLWLRLKTHPLRASHPPSPGRDGNFQALRVIDVIKFLCRLHQDLEAGQHWGGVGRWQRWCGQGCPGGTGRWPRPYPDSIRSPRTYHTPSPRTLR